MKNNNHSEVVAANKVVICVNVKTQKTKSGLELSSSETKPEIGIVVAFGKGKKPVEFSVGDTVVYRKYTDNKIYLGSEEYNFVLFKDVLGKVKSK